MIMFTTFSKAIDARNLNINELHRIIILDFDYRKLQIKCPGCLVKKQNFLGKHLFGLGMYSDLVGY